MIARSSYAVVSTLVLAGFIAAGGACSSDSDASGTSSGGSSSGASGGSGPKIDNAECQARCGSKFETCNAPPSSVEQGCAMLCTGGITEAQAMCLEAKSCDELERYAGGASIDDICPKSSGGSSSGSSSSSSSGGSSSSGNSKDDTPENLTITGKIPSGYKVTHTESEGRIASAFTVAPEPTFDPDVQISGLHLPLLDKAESVTVDSPKRPTGACGDAEFSFALNASQIGVSLVGVDEVGSAACASFTDSLAKGATFTLKGVPWNNSSVKATVKIVLEK